MTDTITTLQPEDINTRDNVITLNAGHFSVGNIPQLVSKGIYLRPVLKTNNRMFRLEINGKPTQFTLQYHALWRGYADPYNNGDTLNCTLPLHNITIYYDDATVKYINGNYYLYLTDNIRVILYIEYHAGSFQHINYEGYGLLPDEKVHLIINAVQRNYNRVVHKNIKLVDNTEIVQLEVNKNYLTNISALGVTSRGNSHPSTLHIHIGSLPWSFDVYSNVYRTIHKAYYVAVTPLEYVYNTPDNEGVFKLYTNISETIIDDYSANIMLFEVPYPTDFLDQQMMQVTNGIIWIGNTITSNARTIIPESFGYDYYDKKFNLYMSDDVVITVWTSTYPNVHIYASSSYTTLNIFIDDKGDLHIRDAGRSYIIHDWHSNTISFFIHHRNRDSYTIEQTSHTSWDVSLH